MLYGLFYGIGKLTRLAIHTASLRFRNNPNPVWRMIGLQDDRDAEKLLADLLDMNRHLAGAATAATVETARAMLARPSVRASLEAMAMRLTASNPKQHPVNESAKMIADQFATLCKTQNTSLSRIGIDGLPGSGKSTLARALAEKYGFKWKSLDHENVDRPFDFSQGNTIYEHHRLFRTQNVDVFDVIIYIHEPADVSKNRVLERATKEARDSLIIDVLDYDKLKKIGFLAFDICDSETITLSGTNILLKIRPPDGFRAIENISAKLKESGHHPKALSKEEMLFLLAYSTVQSGLTAYLQPGAYNAELLRGLLAGVQRYLTG